MSAHQMVCHLCDGFRMALGQKHVSRAPGLVPPAIIKWFALYAPAKWPAGILTRPEVDQYLGGTKPVVFEQTRRIWSRSSNWSVRVERTQTGRYTRSLVGCLAQRGCAGAICTRTTICADSALERAPRLHRSRSPPTFRATMGKLSSCQNEFACQAGQTNLSDPSSGGKIPTEDQPHFQPR